MFSSRTTRRLGLLASVLIVVTLVATMIGTPAAAWSASSTRTYSSDYAVIQPTTVTAGNPVQYDKQSNLLSGNSGSNICNQPSGNPAYNTTSNPAYMTLINNFGNGQLTYHGEPIGDVWSASTQGDTVWDWDKDGNPGPTQTLVLTFSDVITGRSTNVDFTFYLQYGTGCPADNRQTSGMLSS